MRTPPTNAGILLVQADRDGQDMYAEFLGWQGFRPIPVSTAADALTIASSVDVIVTDIVLPGAFDGLELVARLKTNEQTKSTPVIVLTACARPSDRNRARVAGCDVFLPKPCLPDLLVSEIQRVLTLSRVPKPQPASAPPPPRPRHGRAS